MIDELLERHPKPWALHRYLDDYPDYLDDYPDVYDANGHRVFSSDGQRNALEFIVTAVNAYDPTERARPYVDVLFDGPAGPESGRFIECEYPAGTSVNAGEWIEDEHPGWWRLRIPVAAERARVAAVAQKLRHIARERAGEYDADTMWLAVDPVELRALADELESLAPSVEPPKEGT